MSRVLVLSDIHGNIDALESVLDSVAFDEVIVLGDLVDYGPEPGMVIDVIRELDPIAIVRGNHDHAVAYNVDCRCGEATHWLSVYTREHISKKSLSRNDIVFLRDLPLKNIVDISSMKLAVVHASLEDPLYDYLYPWLNDAEITRRTVDKTLNEHPHIILVGHTHYQFCRRVKDSLLVNPGSVGQPRDGDPRASCIVIETDRDWPKITFVRIKYPVEKTIMRLREHGIEDVYLRTLEYILKNAVVPRNHKANHGDQQ